MANLNKVMLIGRLTRDPEVRTFSNGGKVAKFGFAVNNRRMNTATNQWEDEPVFIDCDCFNRGERGRQADLIEQNLRKGRQIFIEGHLKLDQWTSQDGQKRQQLRVVVDKFEYLDARPEGVGGGGSYSGSRSASPTQRSSSPPSDEGGGNYESEPPPMDVPHAQGGEEEIPF